MDKQTNIVVQFIIEGFHYWKDAPEAVKFLRDNHRHLFHFRLEKKVKHSDRDIEIILFGREVKYYLHKKYGKDFTEICPELFTSHWLEFGPMSCEMIGEELMDKFDLEVAQVLEDGENGSITYKFHQETQCKS